MPMGNTPKIAAARKKAEGITGLTSQTDIKHANAEEFGGFISGTREKGNEALANWDVAFQKRLLQYDQEQDYLGGQIQAFQAKLDKGGLSDEERQHTTSQMGRIIKIKDDQTEKFEKLADLYNDGAFNRSNYLFGTDFVPLTSVTRAIDEKNKTATMLAKTKAYANDPEQYNRDDKALKDRKDVLTAKINEASQLLEGKETSAWNSIRPDWLLGDREDIRDKQKEIMAYRAELDDIERQEGVNADALQRVADNPQLYAGMAAAPSRQQYEGSMVSGDASPARPAEEQQETLRSNLVAGGLSPDDAKKYTVKKDDSVEGKYTVLRDGKPALDVQDLGDGKGMITLHSSGDHEQDAKMLIAEIKAMKGNEGLDTLSISMENADPKLVKALKAEAKAQGLNPDLITSNKKGADAAPEPTRERNEDNNYTGPAAAA